jgi:hypothetical protein
MTRRQWLIMAGGVAGVVAGMNRIADGVRPAADVIEDVTDLNWLWRWRLHHIPERGPDGTYLTLVLRSRATPHRDAGLPEYSQRPLPVGHGEDRTLGSSGWLTTRETALTLQLLDMRKFGVGTTTPRPLRVQAASATSGMPGMPLMPCKAHILPHARGSQRPLAEQRTAITECRYRYHQRHAHLHLRAHRASFPGLSFVMQSVS